MVYADAPSVSVGQSGAELQRPAPAWLGPRADTFAATRKTVGSAPTPGQHRAQERRQACRRARFSERPTFRSLPPQLDRGDPDDLVGQPRFRGQTGNGPDQPARAGRLSHDDCYPRPFPEQGFHCRSFFPAISRAPNQTEVPDRPLAAERSEGVMDSDNTPPLQRSISPSLLFSDYHSHPQGHRVQPYTHELLQPWVESARAKGLTDIAFTDHDRYHAGVDFDEIERLREANPDVKIRAGIELDNDPVHSAAGRAWVEKHWDKLDFVLGSVHFLDSPNEMFDSVPDGAKQFAGRDIDAIYEDYFRRVHLIAASGLVDCLAHIDLIKIHGCRSARDVGAL